MFKRDKKSTFAPNVLNIVSVPRFLFPFSLWFLSGSLCLFLSRPSLKRVYPLQVICGEFPFYEAFVINSILLLSLWLSFNHGANLRVFRGIAKPLLSHVYKRQNPGFVFRGLLPIVLYRFRISHLSNENNVAFHGGWCIPFPLSFPLLPNIPGRAFHLPEIPG